MIHLIKTKIRFYMKRVNLVLFFLVISLMITQTAIAQKKGANNGVKTTKKEVAKPTGKETVKQVDAPKTNVVIAPVDPVLLTINGENVTKSEFLNVYFKNNANKSTPIDEKSINEYLELFINFKLKVKEAEMMKLDTSSAFTNELLGYRKQLAQPYLVDKDVNEILLNEAFSRTKFDIRASHILIRVDKDVMTKDTLLAYNKILSIRNRVLKGESFANLAEETSEDPSARDQKPQGGKPGTKGNKGDLGYFSAFDMVYPFENAAFSTPVSKVSEIIRTDFGYHILYVVDKKPALGKVHVAHLLIRYPENATSEDSAKIIAKVAEVNGKIKKGESFDELVKQYSDDKGSAPKGGLLPWFGPNRMVSEFVSVLYGMQQNQISEPVQTMYGWHFIKLIEKSKEQTFDDVKNELKQKIARDVRSNKSKDSFIDRLKAEYSFKAMPKMVDEFIPVLDSTFKQGKWTVAKASNLNKTIFVLDGKSFTQTQFANYLEKHQADSPKEDNSNVLKTRFKTWVEDEIVNYEDSRLSDKYADFKILMKEYRDGILLFDLTDRKVWSKAIKDSTGLQNYYDELKINYKYPRRVDANIYKFKDEKTANSALKIIQKGTAKGLSSDEIVKSINVNNQTLVTFETGIYAKGDKKVVDEFEWKVGLSGVINLSNEFYVLQINQLLEPSYKPLSEIKGIVISEYQNLLEREWIRELKSKYVVVVNQEVFKSIK